MLLIRLCFAALFSLLTVNLWAADTIRQRRTVVVDGTLEEWTLRWSGPVRPVCSALEMTQAVTCPCSGFTYGEQGHLFLERKHNDALLESMDLSPLFAEFDNPADNGNAALVLLPRRLNDPSDDFGDRTKVREFEIELRKRSPVDVMDLRDFTQDGMKASFLLQVGNVPCGKQEAMLIGISRKFPKLHAFSTAAHPERPLVLQRGAWMALLAAGRKTTITDLACGDHGSENEIEQIIYSHEGSFSVRENTYSCEKDGARGPQLRSVDK
ncbi:hypothetical protein Q4S45_08325 [Massilia sp. R2A-15]|uniref:hypothetical protein n=1 Tax=Massilia sp. R2A-15 TaxID=3064278 RepID=UPI002735462F|nr:hypothetical protein [Massilia sp. R2A-15]WLI91111.1 hypothetical protein Q4S45_08325 [Massilia sp. R2A-15]